jgi:hypothetical protein
MELSLLDYGGESHMHARESRKVSLEQPRGSLVFGPNHMIHQLIGVGWVEQAKPIATNAGDGFRSEAGQEIHGWLDRRRASFETAA